MKPVIVVPLVALALAAGGAGAYLWLSSAGSTEEVVVQPTPTPTTAATAVPSLTPTAVPSPTPTPLPGGKAPDGCTSTEKAYVDPDGRFAFCYPSDMELVKVDTGEGIAPTVMHPLGQENRLVVNLVWTAQGRDGVVPNAPCIPSMPITKNERILDFDFSGTTVPACFQDHYDAQRPDVLRYRSIDFEVPAKGGGVVQVSVALGGPDFRRDATPLDQMAGRILDSAVIE